MNFAQLLLDLKNLDPTKRNFVLLLLLFFLVNTYLYNENQSLKEEKKGYETRCSEMLEKAQKDYLVQLNKNRETQQQELTNYYIKTNRERDSTYSKFEKTILDLRVKINKGMKDLNYLKNEGIN
jgi:uncharacterized protein YlxW (UPF0749 family)